MLKLSQLLRILLILPDGLVIWIDNDNTTITVNNNRIASADRLCKVFESHYRRDTQRPRNNSGMRCSAAGISGNSFDKLLIKSGSLGRTQLSSNNRNLFGQM